MLSAKKVINQILAGNQFGSCHTDGIEPNRHWIVWRMDSGYATPEFLVEFAGPLSNPFVNYFFVRAESLYRRSIR
jgi:hypothetical protein